jgi:hypothetical protein
LHFDFFSAATRDRVNGKLHQWHMGRLHGLHAFVAQIGVFELRGQRLHPGHCGIGFAMALPYRPNRDALFRRRQGYDAGVGLKRRRELRQPAFDGMAEVVAFHKISLHMGCAEDPILKTGITSPRIVALVR